VPAPLVPAVAEAEPSKYAGFKVVVDDPAPAPGLGFGTYATALAQMIMRSRAEFAVGIFGGWGSGKTTLMQAVRERLTDDSVVAVWFNAWRYEKEPHLIIPLLDVLRDALQHRDKSRTAPWARDAAVAVGRASRAMLAGLKLSVDAVPGVKIDFDPGKVIEDIGKSKSKGPQSFYHAGFALLSKAITDISGGGARRMVIFVDDLDRCLPASALEMLEAIKLLFGERGCVFVVAFDEEIVNKAIAVEYGAGAEVSGREYLKKIFQVPFTLPRTSGSQLPDYMNVIEDTAGFDESQLADFRDHVRPHFKYLADEGPINPREIKRLINTYVMQLHMLWPGLSDDPDPDVVLALLCMEFRSDWSSCYDKFAAEPQLAQRILLDAVQSSGPGGDVLLPGATEPVPPSLLQYLRNEAWPLLISANLRPYLRAAESAWSVDPWIPQARAKVVRLRRSVDEASASTDPREMFGSLVRDAQDLRDFIMEHREPSRTVRHILRGLGETASQIVFELTQSEASPDADVQVLRTRVTAMMDRLDAGLRDYQRFVNAT
jgi:GTPase SAR1 family protein